MKRNRTIDLLRMVFAVIISIFHMQQSYEIGGFFKHGNIGVSFFFLLSGYFMACGAENYQNDKIGVGRATLQYVTKKINSYIVPFVISWVVTFIIRNMFEHNSFWIWGINFCESIPEILQLKMTGMKMISYLNQTWYLSAMVLTIMCCYPLIRKFKKAYRICAAPLIALFLLGYMSSQTGTLGGVSGNVFIFCKGFLWGMAVMNLGVYAYEMKMAIERNHYTKLGVCLINGIGYAAVLIFLMYAVLPINNYTYDFTVTLFLALGIAILMSDCALGVKIPEKFAIYCGKLSLYVYLIHVVVIDVEKRVLGAMGCSSMIIVYAAYIICVLIVAIVLKKISEFVLERIQILKRKISSNV